MKGKDSFKGMPSWKGKGEGDGKNKGGKPFQQQQPPQANVAQQASSSASQAPEKPETAHAEESWSYDYDTYWTDDWSGYESYYGYDGDYSRGDWYNWSYFAFVEETDRIPRTSIQKVLTSFLRTDRRTRSTGSVFRPFACSDISDTNLWKPSHPCFCSCLCCTSAFQI